MATDHKLHIANATDEKLYVVAGPNSTYAWVDMFVTSGAAIAASFVTAGLSAAAGAATTANAALTLTRLAQMMHWIHALHTTSALLTGYASLGDIAKDRNHREAVEKNRQAVAELKQMLEQKGVAIEPNDYQEVWGVYLPNPLRYFTPSGWATVTNGNDVTLLIANESLSRVVFCKSNSDESWIVGRNHLVRAQHGRIWVEDPAAGFFRIPLSNTLAATQRLLPGECLSSLNQEYDFVYQHDGNAVIYRRKGAHDDKAIWASDTFPSRAGHVTMQDDGNFVVYDPDGKALAASDSCGTGRKIVLEDDGRLVVYDTNGAAQWNSGASKMKHA